MADGTPGDSFAKLAAKRDTIADAMRNTDEGVRAQPKKPKTNGNGNGKPAFTALKRGDNESMADFAKRQQATDQQKYGSDR